MSKKWLLCISFYLADALENIDRLLEIAHVEDWEFERYIAKMSWAALKGLKAGLAVLTFVAYALYIQAIVKLIITILKSKTPPLNGTVGFSML